MPRGDRTGPDGRGPLTGRKLGFCSGFNKPGYLNSDFDRRKGLGRGYGGLLCIAGLLSGVLYYAFKISGNKEK